MEGLLSQDEINALLNGMDLSGGDTSAPAPEEPAAPAGEVLTDVEKDAIGEVANISMGTSATTLYSLVNRKVNITTPVVTVVNWDNVVGDEAKPCVFIQIQYTVGLDGTNILVLQEHDVKVITDLMMGGDGSNIEGELGELHLSAISEAMNQMMGSSATSLSSMLGTKIDISPPDARVVDHSDSIMPKDIADFLSGEFVKIEFRMQIDDLVDSTLMQLYPIDFARSLYNRFMMHQTEELEETTASAPAPEPAPQPAPQPEPSMNMGMDPSMQGMGMQGMGMQGMGMDPSMQGMGMQGMGMQGMGMQGMGMPGMGMQGMGMQGMGMPGMGMQGMGMPGMAMQGMNIQPVQFQNFNSGYGVAQGQENIELIRDVPLEVTVELGRTNKSISDILDFAPGTIIELDKIAGEPIDVLVNGKFVAKGEVVVIEESFSVRITEIIK